MARSGHCNACGATIRPRAKDMSVAAASRLHYWKHHREIMLGKARSPGERSAGERGGYREGRAAAAGGVTRKGEKSGAAKAKRKAR